MGSLGAQGFADAVNDGDVSIDTALSWHLTSNHYPPLPSFFLAAAKAAVEAGQREEWDTEIALPVGCPAHGVIWAPQDGTPEEHKDCEITQAVSWKDDRDVVRAGDLIESFHLDSFLQ